MATEKNQHNGVEFTFTRTETKPIEGKEQVSYWTVEIDQFMPGIPDGTPDADKPKAILASKRAAIGKAVTLLGENDAMDMLQAKLNTDLKAAQLKAGKDVYDMATKLNMAFEAMTVAGRRTIKSPLDVAKDNYMAAMKALNKDAPDYKAKVTELTATFQARCVEIAMAGMPA